MEKDYLQMDRFSVDDFKHIEELAQTDDSFKKRIIQRLDAVGQLKDFSEWLTEIIRHDDSVYLLQRHIQYMQTKRGRKSKQVYITSDKGGRVEVLSGKDIFHDMKKGGQKIEKAFLQSW